MGGGALKCNGVSRRDQGFLKYTLNKYFLLKPKYTLNADFTRFISPPKRIMQPNVPLNKYHFIIYIKGVCLKYILKVF